MMSLIAATMIMTDHLQVAAVHVPNEFAGQLAGRVDDHFPVDTGCPSEKR